MEDKHTFMCRGPRCCPVVEKAENGGLTISDTHADVPSMTVLAEAHICFDAEQATELKNWLIEKGF